MILRNKRAEDIFTLFVFMIVVFFSTSLILSYIFSGILARLSLKWSFVAIALTTVYNNITRTYFSGALDFFDRIFGWRLGIIITSLTFMFSCLINIGVWRLVGYFIFRKIRKRISTDVIR